MLLEGRDYSTGKDGKERAKLNETPKDSGMNGGAKESNLGSGSYVEI